MGVIKRQTFKSNLLSFLAVTIGAFSNIFIFTLDLETKGYFDGIAKTARLLLPFVILGATGMMVRGVPYLSGGRDHAASQLLSRALAVSTAMLALMVLFYLSGGVVLLEWIFPSLDFRIFFDRFWVTWGVLAGFVYTMIFPVHAANYQRITAATLFGVLLPKVLLPILFLAYLYFSFSSWGFDVGVVGIFAASALGLWAYIYYMGKHRLVWGQLDIPTQERKHLFAIARYSVVGAIGSALATQLDVVFVNTYLGNFDTGVYAFAVFATSVIVLPYKAINSITGPIVAQSWKERDYAHLAFLYRETASVLFAVGGVIYLGIIFCLPHLFNLFDRTEQLSSSYLSVVFLGAGFLFDLLNSINGTLLGYSDHYRWNALLVLLMGGLNIAFNYLFVIFFGYGITGAAIATMISLVLFNLLKGGIVYWKLGIHPGSINLLYTILALTGIGGVAAILPSFGSPLLDMLFTGIIILTFSLGYFRFTNGVPPLRSALRSGLQAVTGGGYFSKRKETEE